MDRFSFQKDIHFEKSSLTLKRNTYRFQTLVRSSKLMTDYDNIYEELSQLKTLTKTDRLIFNHVDLEKNEITWHIIIPKVCKYDNVAIKPEGDIRGVVAFRKSHIFVKNIRNVNKEHPSVNVLNTDTNREQTLLCLPILDSLGNCRGVVEFYKDGENAYTESIIKYLKEICYWVGISIEQAIKSMKFEHENSYISHLMACTITYFQEEHTFESFLSYLSAILRTVILADRFIFYEFIRDGREANVFTEESTKEEDVYMPLLRRMVLKKNSIVRQVAETKEIFNSEVPLHDPRIDHEIHKLMSCLIETVCTYPIIIGEKVVGVFEILNKQLLPMEFPDEELKKIEIFCDFLTLGIQKKSISKKICKENAREEYYEELLVNQLKNLNANQEDFELEREPPKGFDKFSWQHKPHDNLPKLIYYIVMNECPKLFIPKNLKEFIIVIKALHRDNFYHNFAQSFRIIHAVYSFIKSIPVNFNQYEKAALLLAACINYIDHRGMNHTTLKLLKHPISKIYEDMSEYPMHLGLYVIKHSKLLDHLSSDEQNQILNVFTSCLSTLSHFKSEKEKYLKILEKKLNMNNPTHRNIILNFIFWCSVNSRHSTSFRISKRLCENLYREFFSNGDIEIQMGLTPLPINDRSFVESIPDFEVQILDMLILPYFKKLKDIFPSTASIYNYIIEIYKAFKDLIELRGNKSWIPDESIGLSLGEAAK